MQKLSNLPQIRVTIPLSYYVVVLFFSNLNIHFDEDKNFIPTFCENVIPFPRYQVNILHAAIMTILGILESLKEDIKMSSEDAVLGKSELIK